MEDKDLNLDLDKIEAQTEEKLKVKNRFTELSEKVKTTAQERDEANAKVSTEAQARVNAEKERDFFKDFSANVTRYPNAGEFQDKILEKVKAGYSTEDAMVSVLAKEGKLSMPEAPRPQQNVAGGSAPTTMDGGKGLSDMTAAEKLSALAEIEKTGGLADALRGR